MLFTRQESTRLLHLWDEYHDTIEMVLRRLDEEYTKINRRDTEWDTTRDAIEMIAKRQALVDLKKVISMRYE